MKRRVERHSQTTIIVDAAVAVVAAAVVVEMINLVDTGRAAECRSGS